MANIVCYTQAGALGSFTTERSEGIKKRQLHADSVIKGKENTETTPFPLDLHRLKTPKYN